MYHEQAIWTTASAIPFGESDTNGSISEQPKSAETIQVTPLLCFVFVVLDGFGFDCLYGLLVRRKTVVP